MAAGRIIRAGIQARHPPLARSRSGGFRGRECSGRRTTGPVGERTPDAGRPTVGPTLPRPGGPGRIVGRVGGAEPETPDEWRVRFRRKVGRAGRVACLPGRAGPMATPVGPRGAIRTRSPDPVPTGLRSSPIAGRPAWGRCEERARPGPGRLQPPDGSVRLTEPSERAGGETAWMAQTASRSSNVHLSRPTHALPRPWRACHLSSIRVGSSDEIEYW